MSTRGGKCEGGPGEKYLRRFYMAETTAYNREYKDTLFRAIFGKEDERSKKWRLNLYNALNDTNYTNPDDLELTTLENVICISMKNDLSFLVDSRMNLYEEQSTYNPNMPLRGLMYFSLLYQTRISEDKKDLYGSTLIKIPTPKYVVFYIGDRQADDITKLKLSDAFIVPDKSGDFEWTATMININEGHNDSLGKKCKPLYDYIRYISRIKKNLKAGMKSDNAISEALEWAIKENFLDGYLAEQKAEVEAMLLTEFNQENYDNNRREEGALQRAEEDAIELLKENIPAETIAKCVKLPLERVLELQKNINAKKVDSKKP